MSAKVSVRPSASVPSVLYDNPSDVLLTNMEKRAVGGNFLRANDVIDGSHLARAQPHSALLYQAASGAFRYSEAGRGQ